MDENEVFLKGVRQEIIDLHEFFEKWFCGETDQDNSRFSSVMADDFEIITPRGNHQYKLELVDLITKGYNTQKNRKIWVDNIETRIIGNLVIAVNNELQSFNGEQTNRLSTAVFSFDKNLPNNCKWEHVHETWC